MAPTRSLVFLLAASSVWAESKLGKPLTLAQPSNIQQILQSPADYTGKTIQVKTITAAK